MICTQTDVTTTTFTNVATGEVLSTLEGSPEAMEVTQMTCCDNDVPEACTTVDGI